MRSIILIVHLSLDGFVAGPGGELSYFSPSDEDLQFVNGLSKVPMLHYSDGIVLHCSMSIGL